MVFLSLKSATILNLSRNWGLSKASISWECADLCQRRTYIIWWKRS